MQVQGQHPHHGAPSKYKCSWLAVRMADLTPDLQVCLSWGSRASTLCDPSLSAASMSFWASQAHVFHQPVYHRQSWLHCWSVPCVYTSGAFSPLGWDPAPQCQAVQVAQWTWWWQCHADWHCRSVWSLPCHSAADIGRFGFVNGQVSLAWSIGLHIQELYMWPHGLKEKWLEERTGSSSLNFFQEVFIRVVV